MKRKPKQPERITLYMDAEYWSEVVTDLERLGRVYVADPAKLAFLAKTREHIADVVNRRTRGLVGVSGQPTNWKLAVDCLRNMRSCNQMRAAYLRACEGWKPEKVKPRVDAATMAAAKEALAEMENTDAAWRL